MILTASLPTLEYGLMDWRIPFGGFKHSGLGREGGVEGFEHFLEQKTIDIDQWPRG